MWFWSKSNKVMTNQGNWRKSSPGQAYIFDKGIVFHLGDYLKNMTIADHVHLCIFIFTENIINNFMPSMN